ncbi:MAG: hypothetical protein QOJ16_1854 [Acidobacteriota bacterium]|jgi:hypothetical protein|nr:hypothetical protein [Acidobacteriota bacterium]
MQSSRNGSRPQLSPLDNAFSPAYLARLRERDDSLTAAEAELAGPWKIEPVLGRPGAVAILRIWEDLAIGDPPVAVLWHLETARLLSVLLPAIDREPLFHVEEEAASEGFPLVAVYGEQGPQVAGWLDRYEPRWAEGAPPAGGDRAVALGACDSAGSRRARGGGAGRANSGSAAAGIG